MSRESVRSTQGSLFGTRWVKNLCLVFVGGINDMSDVEELWHVFAHYGSVINVHIPMREGKAHFRAFLTYEGGQEHF